MVTIASLWLPILLSAVFVFIASALIHMLLGYHASDFKKLPREEDILSDLRKNDIPAGNYSFPRPASRKDWNSPEFREKMKRGPAGMMVIYDPKEVVSMNKSLALWFVFCIVVSIFAAYIAGRAIAPGGEFTEIFRFAGCTAFAAYSLALWHQHIWYKSSLSATLKNTFDGLIYAVITGAVMGWLWPTYS